jgi:hypothetical protein
MNNSCAGNWDAEQVLFGFFGAFLDGQWNFFSFAISKADLASSITDDNESCEGETSSTFNDFSYTVDIDYS